MKKVSVANYQKDKFYPRITSAVARILGRKNFVSPIDLFIEMSLLEPESVRKWKRGETSYLERAIRCNLAQASRILRILRFHAHDLNLAPSQTAYRNGKQPLQFSKTGEPPLEAAYARHFLVVGKVKSAPKSEAEDTGRDTS